MTIVFLLALLFPAAHAATQATCPQPALDVLKNARQLVLVQSDDWNAHKGTVQLWDRLSTKDQWHRAQPPIPAEVGKTGMAWGLLYAQSPGLAREGEPLKQEGDGRSPAGLHRLGARFGFSLSTRANYTLLTSSTVCVDDPQSTHYNQIVDGANVKKDWGSAEDMSQISEYKMGFNILYSSDRTKLSGSCIFLHIWKDSEDGTSGCVAIAEDDMRKLQSWISDDTEAALAFVPKPAWERLSSCLPALLTSSPLE